MNTRSAFCVCVYLFIYGDVVSVWSCFPCLYSGICLWVRWCDEGVHRRVYLCCENLQRARGSLSRLHSALRGRRALSDRGNSAGESDFLHIIETCLLTRLDLAGASHHSEGCNQSNGRPCLSIWLLFSGVRPQCRHGCPTGWGGRGAHGNVVATAVIPTVPYLLRIGICVISMSCMY